LVGWLLRERSMGGVLSRAVEYSSIGARPLVNVYSARELERMLHDAGFEQVSSTVRHFNASDTPVTHVLKGRLRLLDNPDVLDRIGRVGGWYVVGRGFRPPV